MGIFRRIAGFLGFGRDEDRDDDGEDAVNERVNREDYQLPRKGFAVPVRLPVERATVGPLFVPCAHGEGGVQGLRWYAKRLRADEDGDIAVEFLEEVRASDKLSIEDHQRTVPKFKLKCSTRPAEVQGQAMSLDGKVRHRVEQQGRLQWV